MTESPSWRRSALASRLAAPVLAVAVYMAAAWAAGALVGGLLAGFAPAWPRFAAVAAISTGVGMGVSRLVTGLAFPARSGRLVFAAFALVTAAAVAYASGVEGHRLSALPTVQALLLVTLAFVLFWPFGRRRGADGATPGPAGAER